MERLLEMERLGEDLVGSRGSGIALDFEEYRAAREQRAKLLNLFLVPLLVEGMPAGAKAAETIKTAHKWKVVLGRGPDIDEAWQLAYGDPPLLACSSVDPSLPCFVAPMKDVLAAIGAREWRTKGIALKFKTTGLLPAASETKFREQIGEAAISVQMTIYPYFGVFSPTRHDYLKLVAACPLAEASACRACARIRDEFSLASDAISFFSAS